MTLLCPLNPAMAATDPPPVMEARRWIADLSFPASRPLINVSQAAPVDLPPLALRQAIADAALNDPNAHLLLVENIHQYMRTHCDDPNRDDVR